jgi:hypothetical protein
MTGAPPTAKSPKLADLDAGSHLRLNSEGIWYAAGGEEISYPEEGNEACFEVEDRSRRIQMMGLEKNRPIFIYKIGEYEMLSLSGIVFKDNNVVVPSWQSYLQAFKNKFRIDDLVGYFDWNNKIINE